MDFNNGELQEYILIANGEKKSFSSLEIFRLNLDTHKGKYRLLLDWHGVVDTLSPTENPVEIKKKLDEYNDRLMSYVICSYIGSTNIKLFNKTIDDVEMAVENTDNIGIVFRISRKLAQQQMVKGNISNYLQVKCQIDDCMDHLSSAFSHQMILYNNNYVQMHSKKINGKYVFKKKKKIIPDTTIYVKKKKFFDLDEYYALIEKKCLTTTINIDWPGLLNIIDGLC
jgi:hypothetical protein